MHRALSWTFSAVIGSAVGGATYAWLVADPMFAVMLGLFWALGIALSLRYLARYTSPGDDWQTARWSGAAGGLMAGAATLGISPTLPITSDIRLALGLFVLGVFLTALNIGLALGLEPTTRQS
ncbi:hypothetical protein [Halorhabdus salina]|uniref:hypothetical protein n=1 Tax=Halorhabdus salina TaxID=2750670 RepID=UPI0015EE88D8|nr:hypothetical protein [Halorhabdus salina]